MFVFNLPENGLSSYITKCWRNILNSSICIGLLNYNRTIDVSPKEFNLDNFTNWPQTLQCKQMLLDKPYRLKIFILVKWYSKYHHLINNYYINEHVILKYLFLWTFFQRWCRQRIDCETPDSSISRSTFICC